VTTNLTGIAGGTNGITILVNDVTLDLSGFTLLGVTGSGSGIYVPSSERNLAIRNGVLDSWGNQGVFAANVYNSQFERLRVSNTGGDGLQAGSNCVVLICSVSGIGGNGIDANNSTVISCTANGGINVGINALNNSTVIGCTASGNNTGIDVQNNSTVKDCTTSGNNASGIVVEGNNCLIAGNNCSGNRGPIAIGISIDGGGSHNRIDGNTVVNNNDYGIFPSSANAGNSITRNFASGNGSAPYGNFAGNADYAPTGSVSTATNPWTNFQ